MAWELRPWLLPLQEPLNKQLRGPQLYSSQTGTGGVGDSECHCGCLAGCSGVAVRLRSSDRSRWVGVGGQRRILYHCLSLFGIHLKAEILQAFL